ncbi:hypothetical protein ASE15_03130 [Oerskovia sp. Root22]|nr:hypothetical protein ASE15_03130 [Oerskovia sp. Root22]
MPGRPSRRLVRDDVFDGILGLILDGTLAPGERINDADVEAWLGASRTPVRDAIARLERKRLVEIVPQRYTRVAPLDTERLRQHLEVLRPMFLLAVEEATSRLTAEDKAVLRECRARLGSEATAQEILVVARTVGHVWIDRLANKHVSQLVHSLGFLVMLHFVQNPRELIGVETPTPLDRLVDAGINGNTEDALTAVDDLIDLLEERLVHGTNDASEG